jgi:protein AIR1/2
VPDVPSAFGVWNILTGPFSDVPEQPMRARAPRDWENEETFGDGWGTNAPINVGKRARNKDRARMERRALELEEQEQDDQGDWFENARNMRNRGGVRRSGPGPGPDTSGHGFRKKDAKIRLTRAWKSDDPPPPSSPSSRKQSLLDRVGNDDDDDDHGHHSHSRDHRHGHYGRDRERENRDRDRDSVRDRDRDRDRDKDRGRERGGWERRRDRDNDRDWDRGRDRSQDYGGGLSIRGSASRNDSSRRTGLEVGSPREGRRREDSRSRSSRDRDRERESRTSRDRGPRGPQYRGGYTR